MVLTGQVPMVGIRLKSWSGPCGCPQCLHPNSGVMSQNGHIFPQLNMHNQYSMCHLTLQVTYPVWS